MADDGLNERELVTRVCAGESASVSRLYDVCHDVAQRLSFRLRISGLCSQEDMTHDLFVLLLANDCHNLKTWKGDSSLKTWVGTVAINHFRKAITRHGRAKPLSDEQSEQQPGREDDPAEAAIRAMSISAILKAIEQLPSDREKRVILMSYLENRSPTEIAEILGISRGNASIIKHRAIERLREVLRGGLANV